MIFLEDSFLLRINKLHDFRTELKKLEYQKASDPGRWGPGDEKIKANN